MRHQAVTRIRAKNFRSLADVDVKLGAFSVLIGPNGSGKSNLLKVMQFLASTARFDLLEAIDMWGGFSHVQRQSEPLGAVELEVEGRVTAHSSLDAVDHYRLLLTPTQRGLRRTEEFSFKRTAGRGRRKTIGGSGATITISEGDTDKIRRRLASAQTTALATLPKLSDDEGGMGIRDFASMLQKIHLYDPDVELARRPVPRYGASLAEDASNLADALLALSTEAPDRWESLVHDVSRCLPGLEDIKLSPIGGAGRAVVVQLLEKGVSEPVDLRDASFGTVRLLALLCILHQPHKPPLVAIEEIDHGLHPYALDILADRLRSASTETQIIVATHSPTFVNRLRPNEMIICERSADTGESLIPALTYSQVVAALRGHDGRAGELWFAGALGGVPA